MKKSSIFVASSILIITILWIASGQFKAGDVQKTEEVAIYVVKDKNTGNLLKMNSNEWSQAMDQYEFEKIVLKCQLFFSAI